jgi:hypothetical protein
LSGTIPYSLHTSAGNLKFLPVQARVLYDFDGEGPGEITIRSAFCNSKTRIYRRLLY